jgi:formylglycine-generating enzyme required for sulfatase activity
METKSPSGSDVSTIRYHQLMMMNTCATSTRAVLTITCLTHFAASAQDTPPLQFAIISDIGNRDTTLEETRQPGWEGTHVGSVSYEYAIAVRELTVGEYFEFVQAYLPYYESRTGNTIGSYSFTGSRIVTSNGTAWILPGVSPDTPADMAWVYAARYVNWLHHGKVVADWAFDSGAYDTSTFVIDDDGMFLHQETRSPGARFWIPSADEWVKAAYWDPSGEGRYWRYPTSSDIEPIPDLLPQDGGERNAGRFTPERLWPLPVMSFEITSPWGLYDASGGVAEHSETPDPPGYPETRGAYGTKYGYYNYGLSNSHDLVGSSSNTDIRSGQNAVGLRIASTPYHPADMNHDGYLNFFDVALFITHFISQAPEADLRLDSSFNEDDIRVFLGLYASTEIR